MRMKNTKMVAWQFHRSTSANTCDSKPHPQRIGVLAATHLSTGIIVVPASPQATSKYGAVSISTVHSATPSCLGPSPTQLTLEGTDYVQMIEWAADQPWSTGKIGLQGISYLGSNQVSWVCAVSTRSSDKIQWPTAARRPRGLAAICPWEGFGDFYREAARHGGITASVGATSTLTIV